MFFKIKHNDVQMCQRDHSTPLLYVIDKEQFKSNDFKQFTM